MATRTRQIIVRDRLLDLCTLPELHRLSICRFMDQMETRHAVVQHIKDHWSTDVLAEVLRVLFSDYPLAVHSLRSIRPGAELVV